MSLLTSWSVPQQACVDIGRLLFGTLFRLRVEGAANVPRAGGCVLVCNHPTVLDPLLLTIALPRAGTPLIKPLPAGFEAVHDFYGAFGCVTVEPGPSLLRTLRECVAQVRGGRLLVVFPEGGTSDGSRVRPFNPGAARVALEAGCPVIPAAVCGTVAAMAGRAMPAFFSPVTIRFGQPLRFRVPRRVNHRLVERASRRLRERVEELYTPWDPRRPVR